MDGSKGSKVEYFSLELHPPRPNPASCAADDDEADAADLPLVSGSDGGKAAGGEEGGLEVPGAVFNLATTIVGAGIMALPATTKVLGLLPGAVLIFLMGILSEISIELLVRFSALSNAASYGDVVQSALGRPARILAEICIVINNAGVLVVYLIIIGDVMSGSARHAGVLDQWLGAGVWDHRWILILLVLLLFLAPLCFLDRIDSLALSSAASVALAVVFVLVCSFIALVKIVNHSIRIPRLGPDFSSRAAILDMLVVIPIMTNAYVCHFNVQPIYNELRGRSPRKMNTVSRITTALCVVIYASTAISGYLLFGDDTESDVLTNFDRDLGIGHSTALNYLVRVGYVLHLILVFPVIHFSLRQTVGALMFHGSVSIGRKRMVALTVVLLALIYLGSTAIPNIWVAFKFTGATTGISLGFIFPCLVALRLGDGWGKEEWRGLKTFCWTMLVLAGVVGVIGIIGNIYSLE